jgi:hypothetical protein
VLKLRAVRASRDVHAVRACVRCAYCVSKLRVCVRACMRACMRACVHACMRACVHAYVKFVRNVRACVRVCVSAKVRVCEGACVRACMHACVRHYGALVGTYGGTRALGTYRYPKGRILSTDQST